MGGPLKVAAECMPAGGCAARLASSITHIRSRWMARKLTGTAKNDMGSTEIANGAIKGDDISFVENLDFNGNQIAIAYTGKPAGDEIKFTRKVGDFATEELVAKRAK